MAAVAGLDGCKGGWVAAIVPGDGRGHAAAVLCPDFAAAMTATGDCAAVVVDMPIGLASGPPGRAVEGQARRAIGPRRSSVFEPPLRAALEAGSQDEASRLNRAAGGGGISAQAFNIIARIREIDRWITPARQDRVVEGHPELGFATLAGAPLAHYKKTPAGMFRRLQLLGDAGFDLAALAAMLADASGVASDDLIDACVLAWTAGRVASGTALRLPGEPGRDARGLRMEMWA